MPFNHSRTFTTMVLRAGIKTGMAFQWMIVQGKCEPVIFFGCMDLSIGQTMNVSGLSCVSNKVLWCWDSYNVICDLINHQESALV